MEHPSIPTIRKTIRLKNYDYAQNGAYFITLCTHNKQCLLGKIPADDAYVMPHVNLTPIGKEIATTINYMNGHYPNVAIDKYVIMPNHIHFIVVLGQAHWDGHKDQKASRHGNLPLHKVVGQLKSYTNKRYNDLSPIKNLVLWQHNYYEHIIRSDAAYEEIWTYIDTNPIKWQMDKYFM